MTGQEIDVLANVETNFLSEFGHAAQVYIQAPGRVNLIGEHTDYNDGFVLPCAINFNTIIAASKREDNLIRVIAADYQNQRDEFDLTQDIEPHSEYLWPNYIRGVIKYLLQRGFKFGGADLVVSGNVPQGAGLSSSAALEVVVGQTFKSLYNLPISQDEIALNGQQAENQFVGCSCGIMDQLISAKGHEGHALLIDCRSLQTRPIKMPDDVAVVIVNSNVKRELVGSEYNVRRQQCEEAASVFGVTALRDVSMDTFESRKAELDPLVAKRARHVISENERTEKAAEALNDSNLELLGQLMSESHKSMRDDFDITVEPIDYLVDLVKSTIGDKGGVRMTGGGFGGCIVSIIPATMIDDVKNTIEANYQNHSGIEASVYVCTASSGAGKVFGAARVENVKSK